MKRYFVLCILAMLSMNTTAQTSGGEVIRKTIVGNNGNKGKQPASPAQSPQKSSIKRSIDGIELGKTTKTEVISYLSTKRISPKEIEDGRSVRGEGDIAFGGIIWDGIKYCLYNDKVYKVLYVKQYTSRVYDVKKCDQTYQQLRSALLKKYTNHKSPEGAKIPDKLYIKGKGVSVEVRKEHHRGKYLLILTYTDIDLEGKAKKKDYDDL